jgi:hypothetical protein
VHNAQIFGDAVHVSFSVDPDNEAWQIYRERTGGNMTHWEKHHPSIEDIFLDIMRRDDEN